MSFLYLRYRDRLSHQTKSRKSRVIIKEVISVQNSSYFLSHKNSLNQISVAWVMHGLTTLRPFRMRRLLAMTEPCQGWGITFSSCMTGVSSFFTVLPRRNTKSTGPRAAQQSLNDYKHLLLISRSLAILLMFKGNDK